MAPLPTSHPQSPPTRPRLSQRAQRAQRGQSTVELALVLPVLLGLALLLVQVGLLVRDHVLVVHATREAARVAAVDPSPEKAAAAAAAATGLDVERLHVAVTASQPDDGRVRVEVRYTPRLAVPVVGAAFGALELQETLTVHAER